MLAFACPSILGYVFIEVFDIKAASHAVKGFVTVCKWWPQFIAPMEYTYTLPDPFCPIRSRLDNNGYDVWLDNITAMLGMSTRQTFQASGKWLWYLCLESLNQVVSGREMGNQLHVCMDCWSSHPAIQQQESKGSWAQQIYLWGEHVERWAHHGTHSTVPSLCLGAFSSKRLAIFAIGCDPFSSCL